MFVRKGIRLAIFVSLAVTAAASPLSYLLSVADSVVLGTVSSRHASGRTVIFQLEVERPYKGDLVPGALVSVMWESGGSDYSVEPREIKERHRGIWFLRRDVALNLVCIRASGGPNASFSWTYYPVSSGTLPGPLTPAPEDSVEIQLLKEIAAAVEEVPHAADVVLGALGTLEGADVRPIFQHLARSKSPRSKSVGLAGLIGRNDSAAVLEFFANRDSFSRYEIERVAAVLDSYRNPDPAGIRALGSLALDRTKSAHVRDAAASALKAMHTKETLPYLAELLDSPEPMTRAHALFGLSAFANGLGVPSAENIRSMSFLQRTPTPYTTPDTERFGGLTGVAPDPAVAAAFWRTWWIQHKAELTR